MKVLLDTCAVIWATMSPAALSQRARKTLANESNVILVSAASAWEIATKVRLGKLAGAEILEQDYLAVMEKAGYELLTIDTASALRAGRLTAEHKDPFDRMIAAQALALDVAVLSSDPQLDQFGVRRVW
ncbi:MAG: type II toxin-antitoxin system VapC family toxin [Terracidiphilus sp.]